VRRPVEVHIERLVLSGLDPARSAGFGSALEHEVARALAPDRRAPATRDPLVDAAATRVAASVRRGARRE
jgi:hypothetical protein